jgi:hypothetical protein
MTTIRGPRAQSVNVTGTITGAVIAPGRGDRGRRRVAAGAGGE